jgi:RNA polymerase sigma-70 factor (ECF subfamily)
MAKEEKLQGENLKISLTDEFATVWLGLRDNLLRLSMKYQKTMAEAEDAVSETLIRVMENKDKFRGEAKISTWIYSICINTNMEMLRKRKSLTKLLQNKIMELKTRLCSHENGFSGLRHDLKKSLRLLSDDERNVFLLHVYAELPHKETANALNLSVANVKVLLHRSRKKLIQNLEAYIEKGV